MALIGGICRGKLEFFNEEPVLGPTGGIDVGREGRERVEKVENAFASVRHWPITLAGFRSLREKHVCDAFKKDVPGPTDMLETGRCAREGREGVRNAENVDFVCASGEAFLLVTAHSNRLFRAEKGWRGPPQHAGAYGHQFPPLGPTGTTRAGEREGMSGNPPHW